MVSQIARRVPSRHAGGRGREGRRGDAGGTRAV